MKFEYTPEYLEYVLQSLVVPIFIYIIPTVCGAIILYYLVLFLKRKLTGQDISYQESIKRFFSKNWLNENHIGGGMSRGQLISIWLGIVVIVLMGLFPPWNLGNKFVAYSLFTKQPQLYSEEPYDYWADERDKLKKEKEQSNVRIDFARLLLQCSLVGLVTAGAYVTLREKKES